MRSHILLAVGIIAIPTFVSSTHASTTRANTDTVTRVASEPDTVRQQALMSRADEASFAGRIGEARRLYRTLIDEQRASDEFAGTALWRLATTNLYAEDNRGAASVLDELAASAARYGDPTWELRATFEAAVLYAALKRYDVVEARMERVRCLLKSPVISDKEKASIKDRIVEKG